jgi:glycosyltransferase involved in cell wall biosynthesis
MRIILMHFSGPPMIGGVEQTLYYHALMLAELGHDPMLIVGDGGEFDPRIPVEVVPEMYSKHGPVLGAKAGLDQGEVNQTFQTLQQSLEGKLKPLLSKADVCVVHNALTLHKNLPMTAALWDLLQKGDSPPLVGWHHDFAWTRPDYSDELHPGYPWDLLKRPWPGVVNVVVSKAQRAILADLYGVEDMDIHVVPPGLSPSQAGRWTAQTASLISQLELLRADAVLLLPARVTRRKNIRMAMEILAALRAASHRDVRVLVTGPPGPHNPTNIAYLNELLDQRDALDLADSFHFAYQFGGTEPLHLDDDTMANLYLFCDGLLFPSLNEGFGIPVLEAGFARMPIFCSDIPPLRESGGAEAHYFDPEGSPEASAELILDHLFQDPSYHLRRRVLECYTWERIVEDKMLPLLKG